MTEKPAPSRLSPAERAALIASVRAAPARVETKPAPAPAAEVVSRRRLSFATLPGSDTIRAQRAVGAMLGLDNPFYRLHEARAGARSVIDGHPILNFTSYDYLALNGHPEITAAVAEAAATWGTSVSASRLTSGERPFHGAFERDLADLYRAEDALAFVSGHATNLSLIASLVGPKDLVVHDALAHNSIVVGIELSRAHRRPFAHDDLDALEKILAEGRDRYERVLIISEGLFSMDGDVPDLARLVAIKTRWDAWLMIDDAHALGVLGATGGGIAEAAGVDPSRVDIWMGTLSKTLVGCGGYVAGPAALIDHLKYRAPGMVYSVGLSPTATAASATALRLMRHEPERVATLQANGRRFREAALAAGLDIGTSQGHAVIPVIVGDSLRTVVLAQRLLARGIAAVPIIPPGVPEKSARLRFFVSAAHTPEEIAAAVAATAEELAALLREGVSITGLAERVKAQPSIGPRVW